MNICPICEKGELFSSLIVEPFEYNGAQLQIDDYELSECPVCGEQVVLPEQARRNELKFADAKRRHDGLLVSDAISAWRERWGVTQAQAAQLLGGGANAFSKYERGEVIQARSMDLLIRVSDKFAGVRAFLAELAGVPFGAERWEPVIEDSRSVEIQPEAVARTSCDVVDIVAYRTRQASTEMKAKNDADWHSEENGGEQAYG